MMKKVMFTLTPAASKRLIAQAVVSLPEVSHAYNSGRLIVAGGSTNAYIVEELLGIEIEKWRYTAGIITCGVCGTTPANERIKPYIFENGKQSSRSMAEVLADFTSSDVFIKGGNAVDLDGNVGILLGSRSGGTIGLAYPTLVALGANLILPVGLEKLIPSVNDAANILGQGGFSDTCGIPCGMFPVSYGTIVTEIDAISILFDADAVHVASGGIGGSEGSVTLVVVGDELNTNILMTAIRSLVVEEVPKQIGLTCNFSGVCTIPVL